MTKILIVEDEASFSEALAFLLGKEGFDVSVAEDGQQAVDKFNKEGADLILLDLMIPIISGIEVCRIIRTTSQVPIIMLTAKDAEIDKVVGLELGADDYVTKPVEKRILTSRVTQQIKRGESQRAPRQTILSWENLTLDLAEHLFKIGEKEILLTNSEYRFLQLLMENPHRVFSKEQVLLAVSALREASVGSVETYAHQLRTKIKRNGGPDVIDVVRSVGFRLASIDENESAVLN